MAKLDTSVSGPGTPHRVGMEVRVVSWDLSKWWGLC